MQQLRFDIMGFLCFSITWLNLNLGAINELFGGRDFEDIICVDISNFGVFRGLASAFASDFTKDSKCLLVFIFKQINIAPLIRDFTDLSSDEISLLW